MCLIGPPADKFRQGPEAAQRKSKVEPSFRFYALWDKVYRKDDEVK
jgi:hypothetical protein